MKVEPERLGNVTLVACEPCGGFGAVMLDDGRWKRCKACGGGGRQEKRDA